MTRFRHLALLAAFAFWGTAEAKDPYGPSWLAGNEPRPDKVETSRVVLGYGDSGDPIGVQVRLWGDIGNIQKGHRYRLMYQLRLQTKKGETGPLFGDSTHPKGVAYPLKTATADDGWNGLEASIDISRSMLSGLTGLPKETPWGEPLLIRVEPQLFDVTADEFVTGTRPNCLFLAAEVWDGKVTSVMALHKWLSRSCGKTATDALANLDKLDACDPGENKLHEFFFDILLGRATMQGSDVPAVVKAIPVPLLKGESGKYLKAYLGVISRGEKGENGQEFAAETRAAAKAKLEEK